MTNAFDYRSDSESFDDIENLPDSGVRFQEIHLQQVEPAIQGEDCSPPQTESWIRSLIRSVKDSFAPAPKAASPEMIPMEERELASMLEIAEAKLVFFLTIVENRKQLYLNARAAGMSVAEILDSGEYRLDPAATRKWEGIVEDKKREIFELKLKLDTKRASRMTGNGVRPPRV